MSHVGRLLGLLFAAMLLGCASGCFGGTQNPSYFPYLLPTCDVIPTHAKPIGPGYYANFDPHAVELDLEPQTMTSQVGSQVVLLATVREMKNIPRRASGAWDWKVTNGNIIEVDESGYLPGRGWVEGNTATSYTCSGEQRIDRGNANKADDIMLRTGQTWLRRQLASRRGHARAGDRPRHLQLGKRMKTTVVRWVDAIWTFPPRAVEKYGSEHEFVTTIPEIHDRAAARQISRPLSRSRWAARHAVAEPDPGTRGSQQFERVSQSEDRAATPASGINRVSVEIIRPPDPTTPSGAGVTIVTGETTVEWLAPSVKLSHFGPPSAVLGQNVTYTTSAKNDGRMASQWVFFKIPIPNGMEIVSSNPPLAGDRAAASWSSRSGRWQPVKR